MSRYSQAFERDLDTGFGHSWQFVASASAFAEAGDYVTARLGNVPVVVVRDGQGVLHGHVNACRHRLHPVALGERGCRQLFQCRYHGWTFAHDGQLRAAPGAEQCQDFGKDHLGLIPVRIQSYLGLVFANVDPQAMPLPPPIPGGVGHDRRLERLFRHGERIRDDTLEAAAHWRTVLELLLPGLPGSIEPGGAGAAPEGATVDSPWLWIGDAASPEGARCEQLYLWPSTLLMVDDALAARVRVVPTGPRRTSLVIEWTARPAADRRHLQERLEAWTEHLARACADAEQRPVLAGLTEAGLPTRFRERVAAFESAAQRSLQVTPVNGLVPWIWEDTLDIESFEAGAEGVAVLTLRPQPGGAPLPGWTAGAHVDLLLPNGLERQYSLCGDPRDMSCWRIAVFREPRSRGGSAFIHERLRELGQVRMRGPRQHFALPDAGPLRFVAGGIGITPILAMVREAEAAGRDWKLLYGGRSRESMVFLAELAPFGARVVVAPQDEQGLLDLPGFLAGSPAGTAVCACGPVPLLEALAGYCAHLSNLSLHVEHFSAPVPDCSGNTRFDVELRRSSRTLSVGPQQSVLDVVRQAGIEVHSSCGAGLCGSCETVVLAGRPEHRDRVRSAQEHAANGTMMICVSRCKSGRLVLDL